jgi:glycosyltransferase involved in cell wall biosynthesis
VSEPIAAVVTPVRNGARWIEQTIRSVLEQTAVRSGRVSLRYIVMDGGSTDGTQDIVREVGGDAVELVSERDAGMYAALAKGFRRVANDSDVCAYLNAGDLWHTGALDVVLDVMQLADVEWVSGYRVAYNAAGQIVHVTLPAAYRPRLIATGAYGRSLPSIQQESTFWRGSLLKAVDLDRLRKFRLAGDYYLWRCFSERATLYTVAALLGGFRMHGSHLSAARASYAAEVQAMTRRPTAYDRAICSLDRPVWVAPDAVKKALGRSQILRYDVKKQCWTKGGAHRLATHHSNDQAEALTP